MQHLPIADVEHRLVREIACAQCYQRPPGIGALDVTTPRPCEAACSLFVHLPKLVDIARRMDDAPGSCERGVRERVCGGCRLSRTAGQFCAEFAARTCPLSRYSRDVIAALQRVLRAPPQAAAAATF